MTGSEVAPAATAPGLVADPAAVEAARERQSHVRHELRAPLAVIYPLLSMLLDGSAGELTPQQREYLVILERNIERLEALVSGAADSGWTECSAAPVAPGEIDLADLAESVVVAGRSLGQTGPPVAVERGRAPVRAWGDRDDARQIVTGLLRNAVMYAPDAGTVTICVREGDADGTVAVEVRDTGPGMTPEELARAFDFGFRGELASRLKAPGLGIGLWVCRRLAERNSGRVDLADRPGGGLCATLTLPAWPTVAAGEAGRG